MVIKKLLLIILIFTIINLLYSTTYSAGRMYNSKNPNDSFSLDISNTGEISNYIVTNNFKDIKILNCIINRGNIKLNETPVLLNGYNRTRLQYPFTFNIGQSIKLLSINKIEKFKILDIELITDDGKFKWKFYKDDGLPIRVIPCAYRSDVGVSGTYPGLYDRSKPWYWLYVFIQALKDDIKILDYSCNKDLFQVGKKSFELQYGQVKDIYRYDASRPIDIQPLKFIVKTNKGEFIFDDF